MLCWADLSHSVMLCDVLEESPRLQYVPLPAAAPYSGSRAPSRNVCATSDSALRFVNIYPRCCCGGAGASDCQRSRHAYVIKTWTLRMDDDDGDMDNPEWAMDGMVDSTELWALDVHKGLPAVPLDYPIVSMVEPYAICLQLCITAMS